MARHVTRTRRHGAGKLVWLAILAILAFAAFSAVLVACGEGEDAGGGGDSGGGDAGEPKTLRLASAYEFATSWDPQASAYAESAYLRNMYDGLLIENPEGSAEKYAPQLATSWSKNEDGTEWTFKLREGVKFSDGTPFNAEAVKYSFDSTKELGQGASYILGFYDSIEVVDEYTVKFIAETPTPFDKLLAATDATYIFSPATKGMKPEDWTGKSFGTGPYMIESYKLGEEYVFVRNPNWWGEWKEGNPDTVVIKVVAEFSTQRQMLEAGEVDFIYQVDRDAVSALQGNADLQVFIVPSIYLYELEFNTLRAPLTEQTVRQALAWALPYDDIIAACGGPELCPKAIGYIPQGMSGSSTDLPQYTYDPEKAKQLLADAGYPNGEGIHPLTLYYLTDVSPHSKYAPLIKEAYEEIGLKIEMKPILASQLTPMATGPKDKRADLICERAYPSINDGHDMINYQFHTFEPPVYNFSYWSSPETDKQLEELWPLEAVDPDAAQELFDEVQTEVLEAMPVAPLFDYKEVWAANKMITIEPEALNAYYRGFFWTGVTMK
jgi:peptide/nickel transport system substrate-binding protein